MKRFLLFLAALMLSASAAQAESTTVFAPENTSDAPAVSAVNDATVSFDFSTVDHPDATPVAVDPIDKPTPTPAPTPNYWYETYTNDAMGVSFDIPLTWLLNPNTNLETTVQFVEPKSEMMDEGGYQTRVTIEKFPAGLAQTAADAKDRLESVLTNMESNFTTFSVAGKIDSTSVGDAKGSYCYYKATYNDGSKTYNMRGRIMIVAYKNALYQIRITAPSNWYAYYEHAFRKIRKTIKFL